MNKLYPKIIASLSAQTRDKLVHAIDNKGEWGAYCSSYPYTEKDVVFRTQGLTLRWNQIEAGGFLSALGGDLAREIKASRSGDL